MTKSTRRNFCIRQICLPSCLKPSTRLERRLHQRWWFKSLYIERPQALPRTSRTLPQTCVTEPSRPSCACDLPTPAPATRLSLLWFKPTTCLTKKPLCQILSCLSQNYRTTLTNLQACSKIKNPFKIGRQKYCKQCRGQYCSKKPRVLPQTITLALPFGNLLKTNN